MATCELCKNKVSSFDVFNLYGFKMCHGCKLRYERLTKYSEMNYMEEYEKAEKAFVEKVVDKSKVESFLKSNREKAEKYLLSEKVLSENAKKEEEQKRIAEEKLRIAEEKARLEAERKRIAEENAKAEKENAYKEMVMNLKNQGLDGYYEYTTITLIDSDGGYIDAETITANLNSLGQQGWRLVSAYSNELGHNSSSGGAFGFSTGTNATIDQNVLILERFVKI